MTADGQGAKDGADQAWMETSSKVEKLVRQGARFVVLVGSDTGDGGLEVIYLFVHQGDFIECRYTTSLDRTVPTITHLVPAAVLLEREMVDLLGVTVEGAEPNLLLEKGSGIVAPLRRVAPDAGEAEARKGPAGSGAGGQEKVARAERGEEPPEGGG